MKLGNADKIFEIISNTENVSIEYITFVGKNKHTSDISMDKTGIRNSTGIGNNNGIYGYGISYNIRIYNCVFEDFDNSGIKLSYT